MILDFTKERLVERLNGNYANEWAENMAEVICEKNFNDKFWETLGTLEKKGVLKLTDVPAQDDMEREWVSEPFTLVEIVEWKQEAIIPFINVFSLEADYSLEVDCGSCNHFGNECCGYQLSFCPPQEEKLKKYKENKNKEELK